MIPRRPVLALFTAATLAAASFSLATASLADAPAPVPFEAGAFEAAVAAGEPTLVEITASWCPTCREQKEVFADLLQEPRYADLTIFEINFDDQKDAVRALDARMQSTLIVYKGGEEVGRAVGITAPDEIAALLDKAI